jgi:DNA-binding LacI/PurR family transcriptional regulator
VHRATTPQKARGTSRSNGTPTIRGVAERAGVAVSTVSRVLNGGYASAVVKSRVKAAVKALGYTPSTTAQSLVTGKTGSLGVIAGFSHGPFFIQLLGGIEEELSTSRHSLVLGSLIRRGQYDAGPVATWLTERRVDGLIFVRYTKREQPLLRIATEGGLPVVMVAPDVKAPCAFTVRCRNRDAGRLAAEHLLELGHRHLAFVGGPAESIDSQGRLTGIRTLLEERGLSLAARDAEFSGTYEPDGGIAYAARYLARSVRARPTGVILANDAMAIGFMRAVLQAGLRVPEDVSVVGFDGLPEGALFWPGLTTVAQPMRKMGAVACRALLDRVQGQGDAEEVTTVEYSMQLERRESTAPPRGGSKKGTAPPRGGSKKSPVRARRTRR